MAKRDWPTWWDWPLELTAHVRRRMIDRGFDEIQLRDMLEQATSCERNHELGRWLIKSKLKHRRWEIIVEPDQARKLLVVIAAYSRDMTND